MQKKSKQVEQLDRDGYRVRFLPEGSVILDARKSIKGRLHHRIWILVADHLGSYITNAKELHDATNQFAAANTTTRIH